MKEGVADSLLSKEPDVGLDPRTPGSRPEPKADTFFFLKDFLIYLFNRDRDSQQESEHGQGWGRGRSRFPAEQGA